MTTITNETVLPVQLDPTVIERFKTGEYTLTVDVTDEEPLVGVTPESNSIPQPSKHDFEVINETVGAFALSIAEAINSKENPEKALWVGEQIIEAARNTSDMSEDDLLDIISIKGTTQRELERCVAFRKMYWGADLPEDVDMYTAIVVGDVYTSPAAVSVLKSFSENGTWPSQKTVDSWVELKTSNTELDSVSVILNEFESKGVTDYVTAFEDFLVLSREELPDRETIEAEVEAFKKETSDKETPSNGGSGQAITFKEPEDVSDSEPVERDTKREWNDVNEYIRDWENDESSFENTDSLMGAVFEQIQSEFEGFDEYWKLGEALNEFNDALSIPYSTIYDVESLSYSTTHMVYCRKLHELYEFEEYPSELGSINPIYIISSSASADVSKGIIDDALTIFGKLTKPEAKTISGILDESSKTDVTQDLVRNHVIEHFTEPNDETIEQFYSIVTQNIDSRTETVVQDDTEETQNETEELEFSTSETKTTEPELVLETSILSEGTTENPVETLSGITADEALEIVDESGVIRSKSRAYMNELLETYSPAIPSENVLSEIQSYVSVVQFGSINGYWKHIIESVSADGEHDTTVKSITTPQIRARGDENDNDTEFATVETGTPHEVGEHADKPLLLVWPDDSVDQASLAVMSYVMNGGETVLYLGESHGSKNASKKLLAELETYFERVDTIDTVQWETHSDALHVYTRSSDSLPVDSNTVVTH